MICGQCGKELPPENKFCGHCGNLFLHPPVDGDQIVSKQLPDSTRPPSRKGNEAKTTTPDHAPLVKKNEWKFVLGFSAFFLVFIAPSKSNDLDDYLASILALIIFFGVVLPILIGVRLVKRKLRR